MLSGQAPFYQEALDFFEPLDRIACPVFVVDKQLRLKKANPLFLDDFDIQIGDRLTPERGFGQFKDHFSKAIRTPNSYSKKPFEIQCVDKNQHTRFFIAAITTFVHPDVFGDPNRILVILQDITDRKTLEDKIVKRDHKILSENITLKQTLKNQHPEGEIIGKSKQVQTLLKKISQAAQTEVAVLIEGESGTGKELVARRIHSMSKRKNKEIVPVNCANIQENLAESLLFGHKKGAFTGAYDDHIGYLQKANNSTLFLDEVNSLPVRLQAKFLRVLEDQQVTPVGSNSPVKVNFRLICASNQNIQDAVLDKTIRTDFYYRINIISIPIPPLRERKGDIPLLANHFLKSYHALNKNDVDAKLEITEDILSFLKTYSFPGNIRELKNILYRYLATGKLDIDKWKSSVSEPSIPKHLVFENTKSSDNNVLNFFDKNVPLKKITESIEKAYISQLLIQEKYNKSNVADILEIGRKTLYLKIKKYDL